MSDVFISYSRSDRSIAEAIAKLLEGSGVSVWWDRDIPIGKSFDSEIEQQLQVAHCVVVLWSGTSVNSEWVKNEATEGLDKGRLVPALIENVRIPLAFRRIQTSDLRDWDRCSHTSETAKLIIAVKSLLESSLGNTTNPSPPPPSTAQANVGPLEKGLAAQIAEGEVLPQTESDVPTRAHSSPGSAETTPSKLSGDRILSILRGAPSVASICVTPDIPTEKMRNARKACEMPGGEKALALIDFTIFGSAKNALIFGEHAVYYHNVGHYTVKYSTLRGRDITASFGSIKLGDGPDLSLSGATDDGYLAHVIAELLRQIAAAFSPTPRP
jgi:hypothetical protein